MQVNYKYIVVEQFLCYSKVKIMETLNGHSKLEMSTEHFLILLKEARSCGSGKSKSAVNHTQF